MYGLRYKHIRIKDQQLNSKIDKVSLKKVNITNFQEVFNTNVFGLALLTKEIIPTMKKQNQGTIINIGSSASVRGFKNGSVYAASKFAYTIEVIAIRRHAEIRNLALFRLSIYLYIIYMNFK